MKLHNHTAIAVQWTLTSQDKAWTLLPPKYKKKEEESQIEAFLQNLNFSNKNGICLWLISFLVIQSNSINMIQFGKNETTQPHCNSSTVNTDKSRRSEDAVTIGL